MKVYHLTQNLTHRGIFIPAVPSIRLAHENDTIKRISTSLSLEGCLTAMPKGGDALKETIRETGGRFRLFAFNLDDMAMAPEAVIMPYMLVEKGLVPDALQTEEVWLTEPCMATEVTDIQIIDWSTYDDDLVPEWFSNGTDQPAVLTIIDHVTYKKIKETARL